MSKLRIRDNTELSEHRRCNRKYYYRHIRGWVPDSKLPPIAPSFGIAWHSALDSLWPRLFAPDLDPVEDARRAYQVFEDAWLEQGLPDPNDSDEFMWRQFSARTPDVAAEMLYGYIKEQAPFIRRHMKLLTIERPFIVPLDPADETLFYSGKRDKVVEWEGKVWIVDHKTTAEYRRDGKFSPLFTETFSPDSQIDGYLYSGHIEFGDRFGGVLIDAALVNKNHRGYAFIPVQRQMDNLEEWLWETMEENRRIEANRHAREVDAGQSPYMPAFPKNTNACRDFMSLCPFLDFCKTWANPEQHTLPSGFRVERWSPFNHEHLEKLGLKPEDVE